MTVNKMQTEEQFSQEVDTISSPIQGTVESRFNQNTEGWTITADGVLTWNSNEGNPGGCLRVDDRAVGTGYFYSAPSKFLGDKRYALRLDYDVRWDSSINPPIVRAATVKLFGEDRTLHYDTDLYPPKGAWFHYRIALRPGEGWTNAATGEPATRNDFLAVLSSLRSMHIRGEYIRGDEVGHLDNVVMHIGKDAPIFP